MTDSSRSSSMVVNLLSQNNRGALGANFHHGFASASYQIEGGYQQDGRGMTQWDVALANQENGNDACDSYNQWEKDVELLKQYGANSYRFSIAWSRIIPKGGREDPVNPLGIQYYSKLIDALGVAGITPFVTLFHWDLPLELENRYGGFVAAEEKVEELCLDFERYSRVCFEAFGDRVKHWITLNEPQVYSWLVAGVLRKSFDMATERWCLARNLVYAHARVVQLYRNQFQSQQRGQIGITLNIEWVAPVDGSSEADNAAQRSLDIMAGLFADPIYKGHMNPRAMELSKGALKDFSPEEWAVVAGSSDFFGLNHYSTRWTTGRLMDSPSIFDSHFGGVENVWERHGKSIGHRGHNGHPYIVPWGFYEVLNYIDKTWGQASVNQQDRHLDILVTENGYAGQDEGEMSMQEIVHDTRRQEYHAGYIDFMLKAIQNGIPVRAYLAWSLLDNLEWNSGYSPRFGVTRVDRENGFTRTPKESAYLLRDTFRWLCSEAYAPDRKE